MHAQMRCHPETKSKQSASKKKIRQAKPFACHPDKIFHLFILKADSFFGIMMCDFAKDHYKIIGIVGFLKKLVET